MAVAATTLTGSTDSAHPMFLCLLQKYKAFYNNDSYFTAKLFQSVQWFI